MIGLYHWLVQTPPKSNRKNLVASLPFIRRKSLALFFLIHTFHAAADSLAESAIVIWHRAPLHTRTSSTASPLSVEVIVE